MLTELPKDVLYIRGATEDARVMDTKIVKWSGPRPVPGMGAAVVAKFHGPGKVIGYEVRAGWLYLVLRTLQGQREADGMDVRP